MFKFVTIAYISLFACSLPALAETTQTDKCTSWMNKSEAEQIRMARQMYPRDSQAEALSRASRSLCVNGGSNSGESTCREAEEKFNQASGKFSGTCGTAGLDIDNPKEAGKEGSIGCSWSKNRCRCLNKKIDTETEDQYRCSELGGSSRRSSGSQSSQGSLGLIDINAARRRLEACPHEDPDDSDRYEKQLEKAQERMKEARKKMPELLNKSSEAQDKATQAQNDAARKASEKQKEFSKEMMEIKRKHEGEEAAAVQEMAQMRQQMDAIDGQIRQLEMNKVDAETKLTETKVQVELQCHAMASQQVAAQQTRKMSEIKKGMPVGDFNSLLKNVGVSSRDAWEKVADVFYRRCLGSRPTRESKASAQRAYESTIKALDSQILTSRQGRRRIEESLGQIFSNNGCAAPAAAPGQPSGESKLCRSIRQASEDMRVAQQNATQEQQQIQQEAIAAQRQLAQKNQNLQMEYAQAQQELNDEQKRIDNLREYLNLKREKSNGVGGKGLGKANE
jgi:hypothetical protein